MLSEVLDRATEARIVEELRGGDGFRFTHALIRETLYEGLGLLRRRALHRRAGEALVDAGRPDPDTVAHHFSQASDPRVFDWLIQAGDRAKRSYAWLIAAERYEQAAAMIADDPERAAGLWLAARRHRADAALRRRSQGDPLYGRGGQRLGRRSVMPGSRCGRRCRLGTTASIRADCARELTAWLRSATRWRWRSVTAGWTRGVQWRS